MGPKPAEILAHVLASLAPALLLGLRSRVLPVTLDPLVEPPGLVILHKRPIPLPRGAPMVDGRSNAHRGLPHAADKRPAQFQVNPNVNITTLPETEIRRRRSTCPINPESAMSNLIYLSSL